MSLIIYGSIILSILQSIFFWRKEPGISVFLYTIIFITFLIYVLIKYKKVKNKNALIGIIPITLLSSTYFLYNNQFLKGLNSIVIIILIGIMCLYLTKDKIMDSKICQNLLRILFGALDTVDEVVNFFKRKRNEEIDEKSEKIRKIGKSILISIPIIIVVLILLISADQVFASIFNNIFYYFGNIFSIKEMTNLIMRIIVIIIAFGYIGGYLINLVKEDTIYNQKEDDEHKEKIKIEDITMNTTLTILNIIYLIFCIIQFTNLFTQVSHNSNFDYSGYARRGFFQLMFVSLINFGIIFISNINKKEKTEKKYTKIMSILIIAFTIIIIISAFYRMYLYEQEYGYTYLRLFVYFILATELLITIPIIMYILKNNVNLVKSSIIIITTMYLILNFINIDYVIAQKNINRYFENNESKSIDLSYLIKNTDTDAIAQMAKLLNSKDMQVVQSVKYYLKEQEEILENEKINLLELNLSKLRAKKILSKLNIEIDLDSN